MCSKGFWLESKEKKLFLGWSTRTTSLTCGLIFLISKLSQCKKVELSVDFLAAFANFLVSINDTVQLYFQLNFVFIVNTS